MRENFKLSEYKKLFADIRELLERARSHAYQAIDNLRVQTYWQIGERIAREELKHKGRAAYRQKVVERLAEDLGFDRAVLYRILQFYNAYPIVVTLSRQLSWSHYEALIAIPAKAKREFYERQTIVNQWSVRGLREQIRKKLFERSGKSKLSSLIPAIPRLALPEEVFKETYDFEFLKLPNTHSEAELESALLADTEKMLLEFGTDFSLAGRQKKIIIDQQAHAVDLEFFHRGVPCVVLVDLKIGKFASEYVGQMNKYLNYYRENRKYPWEKDPVGLIICGNKGREEAHYALGSLSNRIFVAEYKMKLPDAGEIAKMLRAAKV